MTDEVKKLENRIEQLTERLNGKHRDVVIMEQRADKAETVLEAIKIVIKLGYNGEFYTWDHDEENKK